MNALLLSLSTHTRVQAHTLHRIHVPAVQMLDGDVCTVLIKDQNACINLCQRKTQIAVALSGSSYLFPRSQVVVQTHQSAPRREVARHPRKHSAALISTGLDISAKTNRHQTTIKLPNGFSCSKFKHQNFLWSFVLGFSRILASLLATNTTKLLCSFARTNSSPWLIVIYLMASGWTLRQRQQFLVAP